MGQSNQECKETSIEISIQKSNMFLTNPVDGVKEERPKQ